MANYDNSARFYDKLSRMVYGKALVTSQVYLLQFIPPGASVLIVGGGTGWILEEITKLHPSGLKITYIEISAKMTALARGRNVAGNQVTFINQPVEEVNSNENFDVIITPFLFDNFSELTMQKVFTHLHAQLKPKGLWLFTDFQLTGKLWQSVLLKSMYYFFSILCGIETTTMPDIESQFVKYGYKKTAVKTFFGEFIISTEYQKQ
ncbi:class I SAM-dependent methyltransferase [Mucilaginibacter sp. AW1-3]